MDISFTAPASVEAGSWVVAAIEGGGLLPAALAADKASGGALTRALKFARFKGQPGQMVELLAPGGLAASRLLLVGLGKPEALDEKGLETIGAQIAAKLLAAGDAKASLQIDVPKGCKVKKGELAAHLAFGARLRSYAFNQYRTKNLEEYERKLTALRVLTPDAAAARKAYFGLGAVADGIFLARDLVNEPPNILYPEEFARRARARLSKLGVKVEILGEAEMKKQGFGALLGVGQGSARDSQVVVMRWDGGKDGEAPVCLVGKGVSFDSGGISLKPGEGMQDMKGDMGGAAAVVGAMHALAARKARVNAVGIIGLVENMPDGNAYRPGDILTSMSGQTIEMINTDAEGRLVLADILWYARDHFKPKVMVNLATLTGAIMVALGQEHAGLFSNNDDLAKGLTEAGLATGEKVWRMPLTPEYDKLMDSQFADMKNAGGRYGGAITAAQFLQRFVGDTPWAHLDVAGTAMNSTKGDLNRSWGAGWGVRLLDRLVADGYER